MNNQVVPVRRKTDQVTVGETDFRFAGGKPEGRERITDMSAKQTVHDPENGLRSFVLVDIVIDVPVDGLGLMLIAGGQENQADLLVYFADSGGGFNP